MSLTIPTRLVKISVIEKSYTCFFFAYHDCVLSRSIYCSKRYADSIIEQHEKRAFHRIQGNQVFLDGEIWTQPKWNISFASGSFASCNLFIIRIRCRDAWITFSEKGCRPKFVKRKWKIENNDKEEVQFQKLQKAPARRAYEERKNFPPIIGQGIQLAAVR